jgi:hypothetical protein
MARSLEKSAHRLANIESIIRNSFFNIQKRAKNITTFFTVSLDSGKQGFNCHTNNNI